MRILAAINLILTFAAIVAIWQMFQTQKLVRYDFDEMLHWVPVRSTSSPMILPLQSSRGGSSYTCLLQFSPDVDAREQNIDSSLVIHGEDLEGNRFEVASSDAEIDEDGRTALIWVRLESDDITYLAITLDADLRSKVDIVGVSACMTNIKRSHVEESITQAASRFTLIMLVVILLIQIALLIGLIRQWRQSIRPSEASTSASDV